jgi:RimJ/RimL family protein N-acetyltransferase
MQNPHVIGERVYLRPLERADARTVQPWFNDPEVTANLQLRRPVNLDFEEEFIAKALESPDRVILGAALRADDRLIGSTGIETIDFDNRSGQFGIAIGDKAEWGKGFGTEVTRLMTGYGFERLNLNRLWLHVYDTNPGAARVYERVGYRREGVLRQARWQSTRYVDTIVMGMLREEWPKAK